MAYYRWEYEDYKQREKDREKRQDALKRGNVEETFSHK
jgi:hypothetical protein